MIKVLFLIHDLGGGGAEKVLVNLVNHMDKSKFDITVIALFGGGVNEQFLRPHIRYHAFFFRSFPYNSKLMKLFSPQILHRLIIKEYYDIEISFLEGPSARIISGCADPETKLVSWIHIEQHSEKKAAASFRSIREANWCYKQFDQTICVSETVKEDFSKLFPDVKNLTVCYNVIESERILALKDEPIEKDIFNPKEINLIAVGKIVPQKGFDRLARIVKKLCEDHLPVHLYVLGVGSEQNRIEKYIRENHMSDVYTFLGYQTNPYKYIAKCDLFVCASWAEGFSTATVEALIIGKPVCTVNVSGMKEMLGENNEYGIITKNDDNSLYKGIRYILEDSHLKHYKEKAKERGEYFNTESAVRNVEKLLTQLTISGV